MKLWQSRALGITDIGGGAIGILAAATTLASHFEVGAAVVITPIMILYCFAIYAGVLALENSESAIQANWWLWLTQIPVFTSPAFSYIFSCGGYLIASIQLNPMKYKLNWLVGSNFQFSINRQDPLLIGINLLAVVIFVWLTRSKARSAP